MLNEISRFGQKRVATSIFLRFILRNVITFLGLFSTSLELSDTLRATYEQIWFHSPPGYNIHKLKETFYSWNYVIDRNVQYLHYEWWKIIESSIITV